MKIRIATLDDAARLQEIYAPYVEKTAISFEYEAPSVEEFRKRIENTLCRYPYLVAIVDDEIAGYSYAGQFHTRAAFSHSAELSIYIDEKYHRYGIGTVLYNEMERILSVQNVYRLYASVACAEGDDEYLTDRSLRFHKSKGYKQVAKHNECGYKFGHWYSLVYFEKKLCDIPEKVENFIPFSELKDDQYLKCI